jgi:reverse gyrase
VTIIIFPKTLRFFTILFNFFQLNLLTFTNLKITSGENICTYTRLFMVDVEDFSTKETEQINKSLKATNAAVSILKLQFFNEHVKFLQVLNFYFIQIENLEVFFEKLFT